MRIDIYLHSGSDQEVLRRLADVSRKVDLLLATQRTDDMATKETLDALKSRLTENTNATLAAKAALDHYAQVHADDLAKLATAIANSDASDDPDVKAAIDTLAQNNATLAASTPQVATAITDNTPASAPAS